jgi:hypothetical protein
MLMKLETTLPSFHESPEYPAFDLKLVTHAFAWVALPPKSHHQAPASQVRSTLFLVRYEPRTAWAKVNPGASTCAIILLIPNCYSPCSVPLFRLGIRKFWRILLSVV